MQGSGINIWALEKDDSIKHLLLLLAQDLPSQSYAIVDTSSADYRAVRLCHRSEAGLCAYLYTYGHEKDRYGIHLEYATDTDTAYSDTLDIQENKTYGQLLELLRMHFDISDRGVDAAGRS